MTACGHAFHKKCCAEGEAAAIYLSDCSWSLRVFVSMALPSVSTEIQDMPGTDITAMHRKCPCCRENVTTVKLSYFNIFLDGKSLPSALSEVFHTYPDCDASLQAKPCLTPRRQTSCNS